MKDMGKKAWKKGDGVAVAVRLGGGSSDAREVDYNGACRMMVVTYSI